MGRERGPQREPASRAVGSSAQRLVALIVLGAALALLLLAGSSLGHHTNTTCAGGYTQVWNAPVTVLAPSPPIVNECILVQANVTVDGGGELRFRDSKLVFGRPPVVILLCGLQGSGKTTTAAKLALHLRKHEGKTPGLVAADLQRPAAIDQLEQLGRQLQVPVYRTETADAVVAARAGLERASADGCDVVIVDTAGRLQIDDALMDELVRVRDTVKPLNVLLVLDAMTGQEAVNVARAFQERVAFDGVVLTKLDGDARGGAALSVKAVTGRPVKFASVGEKPDQLEVFHPDRMASRILGMGDVLTLIEKAEQAVEADEQAELERRLMAGQFTFDDFLASSRMLKKMGPLKGVMKLVPGMGRQLDGLEIDDRQMARVEAIVLSMTPHERRTPHLINGPRRRRIAAGSGTTIEDVNRLLQARKQMEKVMRQMGKGKLPTLPPELTGGGSSAKRGRR